MYHKQKNLNTYFLLLIFLLTSLFAKSALNSIGPLQGLPQSLKGSLQGVYQQVPKFAKITIHCHSFSLVVTRCHSLYHSLSLLVSLVVIRCHWLAIVLTCCTTYCHSLPLFVTRCITRLSFYKRSLSTMNLYQLC